jgi:hypothetical protein
MNPVLRNVLAVISGAVIGSIVNITLVNLGPIVIPLPEGTDVSSMEALKAAIPSFAPLNFLFPWLGHALGTLVGAFVAARIAATRKFLFAMVIGVFFLLGGAKVNMDLGGPTWFIILDMCVAYIPMGSIGGKLGK